MIEFLLCVLIAGQCFIIVSTDPKNVNVGGAYMLFAGGFGLLIFFTPKIGHLVLGRDCGTHKSCNIVNAFGRGTRAAVPNGAP